MSAARRDWAWLAALGVLALLGLGSIGLVDYDEAAYAEVARAMWKSGDWVVPTLCGDVFYEKPPLLYWTQVLGYALFGVGEVGARIGTALAGAATPLVLYGFARRPLGARAALFSALALGTSLEFVALSRIAFTDMLLLLWLAICVGALHRAFEEPDRKGTGWFALACVASGLAILAKGAIGVLFPGAVALVHLVLWKRMRAMLRPSWIALALPLVLGIGFSWYLMLGFTHPDGFGFMRDLFLEHHVGRFSAPMQGHTGSPLFYLPVIAVGFLPWSPFLPLALARTRLRGRDERERFLRLFALLSAIVLVFFSIAATKLPNYAAPALPGLALVVGAWFARADEEPAGRGVAWSLWAALASVALLALVFAVAPLLSPLLPQLVSERAQELGLAQPIELGFAPLLAAGVLAGAFGVALVASRARRIGRVFAALAIGFACTYTIVFQGVLPRVDAHFGEPLRRLAVRAAELVPADQRIVMLGLRRRPSVCFYADRNTASAGAGSGLSPQSPLFAGAEGRVGITRDALIPRFPAAVELEVLERDSGFALFRARNPNAER